MESKQLLIIPILLVFLGIISRNFVFLILAAVSVILVRPDFLKIDILAQKFKDFMLFNRKIIENEYRIIDGILESKDEYKAFVIVDDIPFDYRDLSNEGLRAKVISFHKVLDVVDNVDIIFRKKSIDKNKFLESLFRRAQNLRVITEADPSNEKVKNELLMVQEMIKKISEGEPPFQYIIYFVVTSPSREKALASATLLRKGLESIGIKARLARASEVEDFITSGYIRRKEKVGFPTQIPYFTVFSIPKSPTYQIISDGIYLGKEIGTARSVFWNLEKTMNPHELVIGPSGAGKTEFLISTGVKINTWYHIPVVFFDVKNDIKLRLRRKGIKPVILNPLIYSINLLKISENINQGIYVSLLENVISNSFRMDKYSSSILYKVITEAFSRFQEPTWNSVIEQINQLDVTEEVKIYLSKIVNKIKSVDIESSDESLVDKIEEGVYVIDLSLIKSEELKRFVIYSILVKIINKYNIADDKFKISLVIDEAWTILRSESEDYSLVADIIKRGRGYGIILMMATQNLYDLGELSDIFLENSGLLVFMNNGDKKFWSEVKRFANLSDEEIYRELSFLGRGEGVIRFIGDPRPLVVKLDTFAS